MRGESSGKKGYIHLAIDFVMVMIKDCRYLLLCVLICSFSALKGQSLEPEDCHFLKGVRNKSRMICGQLLVPEDHDRPEGKKISISYVVLKSEDPDSKAYPMIHFTGGPGGQSLRRLDRYLANPILKYRDIIRFDQRGIGLSNALPDLTTWIFGLIAEDLTSEEEYAKMKGLILQLKLECMEQGIEIDMYNTFQSARDVGMLMNHLNYEKYNLRGGSYGTRIARVVADMFPEKIHTAIYDSPAPHRSDYLTTRLEDYSASLRKVFDYCNGRPDCKAKYPNLESDYFEVLRMLESSPITANYENKPYVLNPQDAIFMIRYELYRNDSRSRVPRYIRALKERDLAWINSVLRYRGISASNFAMFLTCENYEEYDHTLDDRDIQEKYESLDLMPNELALFTSLYKSSRNFLSQYASDEMIRYKTSEIPSLMFINYYDPVTPPENVQIFQQTLEDSRAFILNEGGHGGGDMDCKRDIMHDFMENPNVEDLNVSCLKLWKPN